MKNLRLETFVIFIVYCYNPFWQHCVDAKMAKYIDERMIKTMEFVCILHPEAKELVKLALQKFHRHTFPYEEIKLLEGNVIGVNDPAGRALFSFQFHMMKTSNNILQKMAFNQSFM